MLKRIGSVTLEALRDSKQGPTFRIMTDAVPQAPYTVTMLDAESGLHTVFNAYRGVEPYLSKDEAREFVQTMFDMLRISHEDLIQKCLQADRYTRDQFLRLAKALGIEDTALVLSNVFDNK